MLAAVDRSGCAASRAGRCAPAARRHRAARFSVAWGYARAAAALGVDIIQNCAVTGIRRGSNGAVTGVETERGFIATRKVGVSAAGNSSVVMDMAGPALSAGKLPAAGAGVRAGEAVLPVRGHVEHGARLYEPVRQGRAGDRRGHRRLCQLLAARRAPHRGAYAGGDLRDLPGRPPHADAAQLGRHRRRDADRSPILGKTPVEGLYVNCGWGTGGFKATPGAADLLAWTIAKDEPHAINAPFNLDRFRGGRLIDEAAAAAVAH